MNNTKKLFYLPNAEFLYKHYQHLFMNENQQQNPSLFKQLNISKNSFISSCENPLGNPLPSTQSLFWGLINPFRFKLYFEVIALMYTFFFFNFSYPFILKFFSTNEIVLLTPLYFATVFLYLFCSLYVETFSHRKIYYYLESCYRNNLPVDENKFYFKFKPHSFLFTAILGSTYVVFCFFIVLLFFYYLIEFNK